MAEAKSKKKQRRSVPTGQLHVQATFNNTIHQLVHVVSVVAKKAPPMPRKLLLKRPPKLLNQPMVCAQLTSLSKASA